MHRWLGALAQRFGLQVEDVCHFYHVVGWSDRLPGERELAGLNGPRATRKEPE
jgi:archaellum component FlaD/FlaE